MNLSQEEKSRRCVMCQKCCRQMRFPLPHGYADDRDTLSFFKARGIKVIENMEGGQRRSWVTIKMDCPHITSLGCDIYPVRPRVCQTFDGSVDWEIGPQCLWNAGGKE